MAEQIELERYPIWDRQPSEPEGQFLLFERYFLASPRPNLTGAYRRHLEDLGEKGTAKDASGQWKRDAEKFRWRERHTAFWRWKN